MLQKQIFYYKIFMVMVNDFGTLVVERFQEVKDGLPSGPTGND